MEPVYIHKYKNFLVLSLFFLLKLSIVKLGTPDNISPYYVNATLDLKKNQISAWTYNLTDNIQVCS